MKKNYIYIFLILVILSCRMDTDTRKIKESFNQLIISLKDEDSLKIDILIPFLKGRKEEEKNLFLNPFRQLIDTDYKLSITKKTNKKYYLKVITGNSDSIWSGIILPYNLNDDGNWVMASIVNKVQTFEIVPAQN